MITLITLFLGFIGFILIKLFFEDHYFNGYPFIPFFFYIYELCYVFTIKRNSNKSMNYNVLTFMAAKSVKLLLGIILIIVLGFYYKNNVITAFMTFVSAYIISIIFESIVFTKFGNKKY